MTKSEARQIIGGYICGCGYPSKAMKRLHHMLTAIEAGHDLRYVKEYMRAGDGEVYLLAYLLDDLELIEHDCSIQSPWLTEKGVKMLDALTIAEQHNYDFESLMEDSNE